MSTRLALTLLAIGAAVESGCTKKSATGTTCSASSCSGCCSTSGVCEPGLDAGACGAGGLACENCEADQMCVRGTCVLISGCIANGAACSQASDCCSADCTAGHCALPSMTGSVGCTAPASYNTTNGGACGSFRWAIKTGTDSAARSVALTPTAISVAQLDALPAPAGVNNGPSTRFAGAEGTLYILKNVKLLETKLEPDSDYHMPVTDGVASMETEIPFPGCVGGQSPWGCEVTHARAALEKVLTPNGSYQTVNQTATIVGVGFFDLLHGSASQAPNGIELHPVLALCFGQDCDPFAD